MYNRKDDNFGDDMKTIDDFIEKYKLLKRGDVVGVGVSGGSDSMALLHYLAENQQKYDIEVVAIHVDHGIRENSYLDADFVKEKAKEFREYLDKKTV